MKALICAFDYKTACVKGRELLEQNGIELLYNIGTTPFSKSELLTLVKDIDAVITGNEVWDEQLFLQAKNLKVIARFGIGVDNIDLEGAKRHGIIVCNAPGATNAVAELVIGMMITMSRNLILGNAIAKAGGWSRSFGTEIRGKKIGLLGFGRIPKLISKKMANFDAQIYAFDQHPDQQYADSYGVKVTTMEEILKQCDIVSLHLPATPQTKHIMDNRAFAQMKKGAFFINTSRGSLVDEQALYNALTKGSLAAAACDVFAQEPLNKENPLLKLKNFYCTPHWGSDTFETLQMVGEITAQQVIAVLCRGNEPENWINRW